jgi:hypothetical protein
MLAIPYTGSGVLRSALAMDKAVMKLVFLGLGTHAILRDLPGRRRRDAPSAVCRSLRGRLDHRDIDRAKRRKRRSGARIGLRLDSKLVMKAIAGRRSRWVW